MRDVDAQLVANVDHVERAQDIGPHRLNLVVLTPVSVGRAARARGVYDPSRLVLDEFTRWRLVGGDRRLGVCLWLSPLGAVARHRQTLLTSIPYHLFTAFYPRFGHDDILALCQKYILHLIGNPAITWVVALVAIITMSPISLPNIKKI